MTGGRKVQPHHPVPTGDVRALLFDLGGVLINIDFDRSFEVWGSCSGLASSVIKSRFSCDAFYESHERGEITAIEYFSSLRASLGIRISDAQFLEGWNALLLDEIPGIEMLLARLKTRMPLYVFSNSNPEHKACWTGKLAGTLRHFNGIFVSCDLGLRKPEPAAYAAVSSAIAVPPEKIMFFDDTPVNIEGARHVGMKAVLVKSTADVDAALVSAGLV